MGCCGGGNNNNDQRVKDWSTDEQVDQSKGNISPILIILGILSIGLVAYKFLI